MNTIITLEQDKETGELILPLSDEILKEVGWCEGDTIEWIDNKDGSWSMMKVDKLPTDNVEKISNN